MNGLRLTLAYSVAYASVGLMRFWMLSPTVPQAGEGLESSGDLPLRTLGLSSELALAWIGLGLFSLLCIGTVYLSERHAKVVGKWLRERPWRALAVGFPYFFLLVQVLSTLIDLLSVTKVGQWLAPHDGFVSANSFLLSVVLYALVATLLGPTMLRLFSRRYS